MPKSIRNGVKQKYPMHKVKELQRILPEGLVADTQWFAQRGYTSDMLSRYVKQGWLDRPARGVYRRPAPPLLWQQIVISLQSLMNVPVAVGATTALRLQGHEHYVTMGSYEGDIWLTSPWPLPRWVLQVETNAKFYQFRSGALWPDRPPAGQAPWGLKSAMLLSDRVLPNAFIRKNWGTWSWPLVMSSEERALIEAFLPVTGKYESSFDMPLRSTESMFHLQWERLQGLLETCRSKRVKRLVLWMAEYSDLPFSEHLDLDRVELGSSTMRLVPPGAPGRFSPGQRLYVPDLLYYDRPSPDNVF